MSFLAVDVGVCRKGITIVFSQMLQFKKKKLHFQMQEEGVVKKTLELEDEEGEIRVSSK